MHVPRTEFPNVPEEIWNREALKNERHEKLSKRMEGKRHDY